MPCRVNRDRNATASAQSLRLSAQFEQALVNFTADLPYEFEEAKLDAAFTRHLSTEATRWAALGSKENYKQEPHGPGQFTVTYEAPHPLTESEERRLFQDKDELVRWTAGQLMVSLCIVHTAKYKKGIFDHSADEKARQANLGAALDAVDKKKFLSLPQLPDAWIKVKDPRHS